MLNFFNLFCNVVLDNKIIYLGIRVTTVAVCDDEDYFYDYIDNIYKDLGVFE